MAGKGRPVGYRKQFCPNKHDTFVVGRYKNNMCIQCTKDRRSREYQDNPEFYKSYQKDYNKAYPEISKSGEKVRGGV